MRWLLSLVSLSIVGCGGMPTCTPETDRDFCMAAGKDCESYTGFDSCGASRTVNCGTCNAGQTCMSNVCLSPMADAGPPDGGAPGEIEITWIITNNPDNFNGHASTDALDPLEGMTLDCRGPLPSLTRTTGPIDPTGLQADVQYDGTMQEISCTGSTAPIMPRIESSLRTGALHIELTHSDTADHTISVYIEGNEAAEYFSLGGSCQASGLSEDADGHPVLTSILCGGGVYLRRFATAADFTDVGTGDGTFTIISP